MSTHFAPQAVCARVAYGPMGHPLPGNALWRFSQSPRLPNAVLISVLKNLVGCICSPPQEKKCQSMSILTFRLSRIPGWRSIRRRRVGLRVEVDDDSLPLEVIEPNRRSCVGDELEARRTASWFQRPWHLLCPSLGGLLLLS